MSRHIHVIASCTDRKTLPAEARLREISAKGGVESRAKEWWRELHHVNGKRRPAADTYAGDHWAVVRSIPEAAKKQRWEAKLWVLSAGYGLIPADAPLHGYSATFAYGHEDSVGNDPAALSAWWRALSQKALDGHSGPRSLEALLKNEPKGVFLIVASPNYLTAVEDDLLRGTQTARRPRVLIISSGHGLANGLTPWLVTSTSELQYLVGGTRAALHARVARRIVEKASLHGFDLQKVKDLCAKLVRPGSGHMPVRAKQGDAEVQEFIRTELQHDASISYTALLRKLRDSRRACEMRRFKALYAAARKSAAHVS